MASLGIAMCIVLLLSSGCASRHVEMANSLCNDFAATMSAIVEAEGRIAHVDTGLARLSKDLKKASAHRDQLGNQLKDAERYARISQEKLTNLQGQLTSLMKRPYGNSAYRKVKTHRLLYLGLELKDSHQLRAAAQAFMEYYEREGSTQDGYLALAHAGDCFAEAGDFAELAWVAEALENERMHLEHKLELFLNRLTSKLPPRTLDRVRRLRSQEAEGQRELESALSAVERVRGTYTFAEEKWQAIRRDIARARSDRKDAEQMVSRCLQGLRHFLKAGHQLAEKLSRYVEDDDRAADAQKLLIRRLAEASEALGSRR